jgi:hypothetical protein
MSDAPTYSERWERGIPHDPRSLSLYAAIEKLDAQHGDVLALKAGGDGDNGEHLLYLLDLHFASSSPAPTAALDAERERVVRETVEWCYEHPAKRTTNDKCEAEKLDSLDAYLARALAAAKGGG